MKAREPMTRTGENPDTASADCTSPAVTVVIPSYGGAGTIRRAVGSALAQRNAGVSVIVVIDDECVITRRKVEELGDERVTVLTNPTNVGAPASRNRGLELADSPYVLFLDADDYLQGDFLAPLAVRMA